MDWFNPFEGSEGGGGGSGTDNYNELINKPSINNVVLSGNKTGDDLGLQEKISSNNKISSDNVNDLGAQNLFTNATEKQIWNAKQDAIQNLQDIQNGAALGATSLQPSDVKSTYSSSGTDPVNGKAVAAAIGTLDVVAVGGSGSFISGISETNGKISATVGTVDSTPTESSTALVTSAGIYTDQARQDALEAQDRAALIEVVDAGAKNVLNYDVELLRTINSTFSWTSNTAELNGVYFTVNNDNTISVITDANGATDLTIFYLTLDSQKRAYNGCVLSGCPSDGSNTTYELRTSTPVKSDYGSGTEITSDTPTNIVIIVRAGLIITTAKVFKPMICTKAQWDISHQYEPYARSNPALTAEMDYVVNAGAKNFAPIEMGGNKTGNKWIIGKGPGNTENIYLPAGQYIFTAISASSGSGQCQIKLKYSDGTTSLTEVFSFGSTMALTFTASKDVVGYGVYSNPAPVTFEKMMIRPVAITDATFQPYALPNPVLTPALIEQVDNGAKNLLNMSGAQTFDVTGYGIHCTINELTGVITLDGVNQDKKCTGSFNIKIADSTALGLQSGVVYKLNCDGYTTSDTTIGIYVYTSGATPETQFDTYAHTELAWNTAWEQSNGFRLFIRSGTVVDNITLRPMLCTKAAWDVSHKYVPYKQDITWGLGDKIQQNSDFNSYTTPGVYRVENSTDAATMLHIPVTNGGGRLEVKGANASNRIIQTYYISISTFTRYYNGTTWSDWAQILSTATLDEIPTANSTNAVMSGGVWTDQQRQETEIGVVANAGAKNLLRFNAIGSGVSVYGNTYTHNGITYTLNADMTVTATGTADSTYNSYAYLILDGSFAPIDDYCDGKHIVSGCPANGSTSKYRMYITRSGWGSLNETGSGAIIPDKGNYSGLLIACFVSKGYEIPDGEPLVFKPMIRSAEITDSTFVSYALPNPVITPALIELVDGGAKNVRNITLDELKTLGGNAEFAWSGNVATKNNVSFTINTDGTITVNAEQAASAQVILDIYRMPSDASDMVLSGAPAGGNAESYFQYVKGTTFRDYGEGIVYSKTGAHSIGLVIAQGYRPQNLTFKPMICTKAAWDISHAFQPYRPSYQELYEMILAL